MLTPERETIITETDRFSNRQVTGQWLSVSSTFAGVRAGCAQAALLDHDEALRELRPMSAAGLAGRRARTAPRRTR